MPQKTLQHPAPLASSHLKQQLTRPGPTRCQVSSGYTCCSAHSSEWFPRVASQPDDKFFGTARCAFWLPHAVGHFKKVRNGFLGGQDHATEEATYRIQRAQNSAELRSAASLRAMTFFAASKPNCSELAALSLQRMRAEEMWEYLEGATSFQSTHNKEATLICFLATTADVPENSLAVAIRREADVSCTLPAEGDEVGRVAIGSLDLTIGPRLVGEGLAGHLPSSREEALRARGYLSNVCVAAQARRLGVAAAMIGAAQLHARSLGVRHLYVHCDVNNSSAKPLYRDRSGFQIEQREDAAKARSLNRSRRTLLHKCISPG